MRKAKLFLAAVFVSLTGFLSAASTTAASAATSGVAAGFSGLGSITQLIWDLFAAVLPIGIALVIIALIDTATGGHIRKFMGGLI